jgi:hypothetical protein
VKRAGRGVGCVTAAVAVPLAAVVAVVAIGGLVSHAHRRSAREDLDRRARAYASALGESYARGRTDAAGLTALARSAGGGRLGMVRVTPSAHGAVVDFEGDERYSTPGNAWGNSVVVCYRATLGGSGPARVPLTTVTC